jgi:hypothetical protein
MVSGSGLSGKAGPLIRATEPRGMKSFRRQNAQSDIRSTRPSRKKVLLLLCALFQISFCPAQTTDLALELNSGLFSFGGASAERTSFINLSDVANMSSAANNPYGRRSGTSFGFAMQLRRITKSNFLFGFQAGYESLASKIKIDGAFGESATVMVVNDGKAILRNEFVNAYPFAGKRFQVFGPVSTDLSLGLDLGFGLSSKECSEFSSDQDKHYTFTAERRKPDIDWRPRLELVNYYRRVGLSLGYSFGLTNYTSRMVGANRTNQSRYARIGLNYLIFSNTNSEK